MLARDGGRDEYMVVRIGVLVSDAGPFLAIAPRFGLTPNVVFRYCLLNNQPSSVHFAWPLRSQTGPTGVDEFAISACGEVKSRDGEDR